MEKQLEIIENMPIKEINGQRIITFKDIDAVHGRPKGTASRAFGSNRKHFIEGVDYFVLKPNNLQNGKFYRSENVNEIQMDEFRPSNIIGFRAESY